MNFNLTDQELALNLALVHLANNRLHELRFSTESTPLKEKYTELIADSYELNLKLLAEKKHRYDIAPKVD